MSHFGLYLYNLFFRQLPFAKASKLRIWFLRRCGVVIGEDCTIQEGVYIKGSGRLSLGSNVTLRSGVFIECGSVVEIGSRVEVNYGTILCANCGASLTVGDDVHIAHNVSLKCSTHKISTIGKSVAGDSLFLDIKIGAGSWLCAGSIILPGVTLGMRNVVGAGAVVLNDTDDDALMVGVPAVTKKLYRR